MAYVARPRDFHGATPYQARALPQPARRGFWRTLVEAITLAHQRDAQREIDRYVARRGKLTDSIEREITEQIIRNRFL